MLKISSFTSFISERIGNNPGSFSTIIVRIAMGSIAIGLAVMLIAFMVFKGFKTEIQEKIFGFYPHINIVKYDLNNSYKTNPISIREEIYTQAASIENVSKVEVYAEKPALLKSGKNICGVVLRGLAPDFDTLGFAKNIISGSFINWSAQKYAKEIIISQEIANKLELEAGNEILLFFNEGNTKTRIRKVTVKGIYFTGIEDFDKQVILGDIRLIRQLNGWSNELVGGFGLYIHDFEKLEQTHRQVYQQMNYDLQSNTVKDRFVHLFDWFIMLNRNVYVLLFIILSVVSFNIIAIVLILIMERTNMIGTLKALGTKNTQIQSIFIISGLKIAQRGMILGNSVAIAFGLTQQYFRWIPLNPDTYYMSAVPIQFDWLNILTINALMIILISGILSIPTLIISGIAPINAIKFD